MRKGIAGAVSLAMLATFIVASSANAVPVPATGNELLSSLPARTTTGSGYWTSSNIREWLNSDQATVPYTGNKPAAGNVNAGYAYDTEAGFLSNFTAAEKTAIAVTAHRELSADVAPREGGTLGITRNESYIGLPYIQLFLTNIQNVWKDTVYKTTNDKFFILGGHEAYEYVQKHGISLKKGLTPAAKSLHNISSETVPSWFSTVDSGNWGDRMMGVDANGAISYLTPNLAAGVAPAMHIKPTYVFSNGKTASSLVIGETVTFGKYLNEAVQWTVINKTANGYPLLWATNNITMKSFDAAGDTPYRYSNIDFATADVSIKDNLQYLPRTGTDIIEPVLSIGNPSDLTVAKTGPWVLQIKATDTSGSGVKSIKLPDGTVVTGATANFTVTKNNFYSFEATDNSGNVGTTVIPVGNIMPPASVSISATEGWFNANVPVKINASNAEAGFKATENFTRSTRDWLGPIWPDYSSYASKRVQITGKVRLANYSAAPTTETTSIGLEYSTAAQNASTGIYNVTKSWYAGWSKKLSEMTNKQWVSFDVTQTIAANNFGTVRPWTNISVYADQYGVFEVEYADLTYKLLDQEDFGIKSITLPNNQVINASSYTDTITTSGTYTYKVLDSRGVTTTKTVTVNIDRAAPTINVAGNPTAWTKENVTLNVTSADTGGSAIKRILKPNGEWANAASLDYVVTANGDYTFTVEDNAGNQAVQTVKVAFIDKTPSTLTATPETTDWIFAKMRVDLSASDAESGLDYIELPDGSRVAAATATHTAEANGTYTYKAVDKAGNVTSKSVTIATIVIPVYDVQITRSLASPLLTPMTSGDPVTWKYTVVNKGNTSVKNISLSENVAATVSCPKTELTVNETMICTSASVLSY